MFCSAREKISASFTITSKIVVTACATINNITEKFFHQENL